MPIIKEIKNPEQIRQTLVKYPGRVSEAVVNAAVARYEQLQQKYDIIEPVPTEAEIAETDKRYEKGGCLDPNDAIPFYRDNFDALVSDAKSLWPDTYSGPEGKKRLQELLESRSPKAAEMMKDLYMTRRLAELLDIGGRDARDEKLRTAASDFLKWAGLYPTEEEFEHIIEQCWDRQFFCGISDLTAYSKTLFEYRNRNATILDELNGRFVLDAQDLKRLNALADKERQKLTAHIKKVMRKTKKPVFEDEPEIQEHYKMVEGKIYKSALNLHNAKIGKEYRRAIESIVAPAGVKKEMIFNIVNMQKKNEHPSAISAYIGSFDSRANEPSEKHEPRPCQRFLKIHICRQLQADENAQETRKKLVDGLSEDAGVPAYCIEKNLARFGPLSSDDYTRIGNEYYLLKDMNHYSGQRHCLVKQAVETVGRGVQLSRRLMTGIETAQMFA